MVVSASALRLGDRMACWGSHVDAADAKRQKLSASICELRTPSPPLPTGTGSESCSHWASFSSTMRTVESPVLRVLPNWTSNGFSLQCVVLRMYSSFGTVKLILSNTGASCDCSSKRRATALFRGRDSRVVSVSDLNAEGPGSNPGMGKEIEWWNL